MRDLYSAPRMFVAHQGHSSRWYQLGGRTRPLRTSPRMIEIYEGGLTFDHCRWQGEPGRSVLIEFTDADVQAVTHGELQRLDLHHRKNVEMLFAHLLETQSRIAAPRPSGIEMLKFLAKTSLA